MAQAQTKASPKLQLEYGKYDSGGEQMPPVAPHYVRITPATASPVAYEIDEPEGFNIVPSQPQGIDPRVLRSYRNVQGVQNMMTAQQDSNPYLTSARNVVQDAYGIGYNMAAQPSLQQPAPTPYASGWRGALQRMAGSLNGSIAARNNNTYNQQSENWRLMYSQNEMNRRAGLAGISDLANNSMANEAKIYENTLKQSMNLTDQYLTSGDPSGLNAMIKNLADNYPDPQKHAAAVQGIARAWRIMGVDQNQIAALESMAGMSSQKAGEISQGRLDRHAASENRLQMQDLRAKLLGLQIQDKQFDVDTNAEKWQLESASKKAKINSIYRSQVEAALKDAAGVDADYNSMMKEITGIQKDVLIPSRQKSQLIGQIVARIRSRYGDFDHTGVPRAVREARLGMTEYRSVLAPNQVGAKK